MLIWVLAVIIGCVAGVITPAAWWLVFSLEEKATATVSSLDQNILYSIAYPAAVAAIVYGIVLTFRAFRSADAFTYFISDLHFEDGRRKIKYSLAHSFASLFLVVGKGIIGIEGFTLELMSALGSYVGVKGRLSVNQIRTLSACGATAALAAMLGQPTAAFLFIVELLYGWGSASFSVGTYAVSAFVAASIAQSMMTAMGRFSFGVGPDAGFLAAIRTDTFQISAENAVIYLILASVVSGLAAAFQIWLFRKTDRELHGLFETRRASDISSLAFFVRLTMWAALTAAALFYFPQAIGTGVTILHDSLSQGFLWKAAILAILLRFLIGALSYSVIGSMGLVLPTLVMGALLGSSVSLCVKYFVFIDSGVLTLLCTGAFFSAAFGTPVAATALVFGYASAMGGDSAILLFTALISNFAAHYICGRFQIDRVASMGLYRHGIRFRQGMCYNTLSGIQVSDAMITYINPVPKSCSLGESYKKLMNSKFTKLPVVDDRGYMQGMISLSDFYGLEAWKRLGEESQVHHLVGVDEMVKPSRIIVRPDMNLESALQSMSDEELAPVVDAENKFVGVLLKSDLVNLYNKEVVKKAFRR